MSARESLFGARTWNNVYWFCSVLVKFTHHTLYKTWCTPNCTLHNTDPMETALCTREHNIYLNNCKITLNFGHYNAHYMAYCTLHGILHTAQRTNLPYSVHYSIQWKRSSFLGSSCVCVYWGLVWRNNHNKRAPSTLNLKVHCIEHYM